MRALARKHGIRPSRALGQNFVIDPNTLRRLIRLAEIHPSDRIIEVGAGFGVFTAALAEAAASVTAIELDRGLLPALEEIVGGIDNVRVVHADALKIDYGELTGGVPHRMVSNLPYNIATPLIATLLEEAPEITDFTVVVQKEAGERFAAGPGSKTYGAVSVLTAYFAEARVLGRVPAKVFWPVPNVESVAIRIIRRPPQVDVDFPQLMAVVRGAFSQRRKTLRNSLAASAGLDADRVAAALTASGLDPAARPETLGLQQFAGVAKAMASLG